jgi:drug/metabolite transporter (DMT)-like permease
MQMIVAGCVLVATALLSGEGTAFSPERVTTTSLVAYLYLTLFGSLISYSAYFWLLGHTTPSRLATISYVNPLVAVLLGWALAGESLTLRTALAAAIILLAVGLITSRPATRSL